MIYHDLDDIVLPLWFVKLILFFYACVAQFVLTCGDNVVLAAFVEMSKYIFVR